MTLDIIVTLWTLDIIVTLDTLVTLETVTDMVDARDAYASSRLSRSRDWYSSAPPASSI